MTLKGVTRAWLIFLAGFALAASRRHEQLISPQVWSEDGTQVLPGIIAHGWATFLQPVNGYLITVPKLISAVSVSVSFSHYPIVSTILSFIFIAAVGVAVAVAPTQINGRMLCAMAIYCVPSDPEVFGLPLYTFWWAAILIFLLALWERSEALGTRLVLLVVAGISSPVIILALPIFLLRAYLYRLSAERAIVYIATGIAVVQLFFILPSNRAAAPALETVLTNVVPKFFGAFLVGNFTSGQWALWAAGLALIFFAGVYVVAKPRFSNYVLLYLLIGSIALSVTTVDPAHTHHTLAGPRYFFYPFVLTFWMLIQAVFQFRPGIARVACTSALIVATLNAVPAWARGHVDLHWYDHVRRCPSFRTYALPVHTDGRASSEIWFLHLTGETCARLLEDDVFHKR